MYIINENETYDLNDAIESLLENKLESGASLSANVVTQHYIELINFEMYKGLHRTVQQIEDRNNVNMKFERNVIGVQFYDIDVASIQIGEEQYNLSTGKKNISPIIYMARRFWANKKDVLICNNGYLISNPDVSDLTMDEFKKINSSKSSKTYVKKKSN